MISQHCIRRTLAIYSYSVYPCTGLKYERIQRQRSDLHNKGNNWLFLHGIEQLPNYLQKSSGAFFQTKTSCFFSHLCSHLVLARSGVHRHFRPPAPNYSPSLIPSCNSLIFPIGFHIQTTKQHYPYSTQ